MILRDAQYMCLGAKTWASEASHKEIKKNDKLWFHRELHAVISYQHGNNTIIAFVLLFYSTYLFLLYFSQHAALSQPKRTFVLKPSSWTPTKLSFVSHLNHVGLRIYGWDVMCRPRPLDRGGRNPQLTGHHLCNGLTHHCSLVEHPSTL